MIDETLNPKRIRDHAPYRKSIALTEEDIQRLSYMESAFSRRYPLEVPFSFSKTISKAIELAYLQLLSPNTQSMQKSLTGLPADQGALQERQDKRQQNAGQNKRIGKFQKKK